MCVKVVKWLGSSWGFGNQAFYKAVVTKISFCNIFVIPAAGTAFTEASQLQLNQLQNKHEAAQHYVDAANCYKKSDNEGTVLVTLV